eukprot:SAG31_NODE_4163_length_3520_cov_3.090032_3_plen_161_part_00
MSVDKTIFHCQCCRRLVNFALFQSGRWRSELQLGYSEHWLADAGSSKTVTLRCCVHRCGVDPTYQVDFLPSFVVQFAGVSHIFCMLLRVLDGRLRGTFGNHLAVHRVSHDHALHILQRQAGDFGHHQRRLSYCRLAFRGCDIFLSRDRSGTAFALRDYRH